MRYCGSKRRFMKELKPILMEHLKDEKKQLFVDAFCGGANVVCEVDWPNKWAIELNRYVYALWVHLQKYGADGILEKYGDISDVLSQLVRTALIPPAGGRYCVADFSAIEARVISWLANEEWRLEVFRGDGKIYEATASRMFGVPISAITKDSDYRKKGKVSELALGYQGGVGAMKKMGGEAMGLTEREMQESVYAWRAANPKIVQLWKTVGNAAIEAVRYHRPVKIDKLEFNCNGEFMAIKLPSDRKLFYYHPKVQDSARGYKLTYEGLNQETKVWGPIDTHGGKLVENIVQAVSRDLIGFSMMSSEAAGFPVVMHVHDEEIAEITDDTPDERLDKMITVMTQKPDWAEGLPLNAAGYTSYYYKKD